MQETLNLILSRILITLSLCGAACSVLSNSPLNTISSTQASPTPTPATGSSRIESSEIEIRLDFHPFTDSTSRFSFLHSDGSARVIVYDRSQLVVKAVYEGKVSEERIVSLLNKTREPAFQEALQNRNFSGKGLSRGDQFYLSLESKGEPAKDAFGFVLDTNTVMQALIEDMLGLEKHLTKVPLADAYIVSQAIPKDRFEKLRKKDKLRFILVSDFPSKLQSVVSKAVGKSQDFQALNREQYEQIIAWSADVNEFFVIANDSGHQLTLFKPAKVMPAREGDKND